MSNQNSTVSILFSKDSLNKSLECSDHLGYTYFMGTSIKELQTLTDREIYYRVAERIEDWACKQGDYKEALIQKWQMLTYSDSNPFLGGSR